MRINHINIAAPAALLEAVKEFYCTALELETGPRPDFGIPGYWLYGDGKAIIHLLESDNHQGSQTPYYLDHIAFDIQGLDAYTGRLDKLGVEHSSFFNQETNATQVFCKDPCGIGVEANIPKA